MPAQLLAADIGGTPVGAAEPDHNPLEIAELAGAIDLRVARQHLLDECGAGARHAENKDGERRRVALPGPLADDLGAEQRPGAVEPRQYHLFVINGSPALQRIALDEVGKRALVLSEIAADLAQREMEMDCAPPPAAKAMSRANASIMAQCGSPSVKCLASASER